MGLDHLSPHLRIHLAINIATLPINTNPDRDTSSFTTNTTSSTSLAASAADCGFDDSASIRTTATTISLRSVRSMIPSFTEELRNSRAYRRLAKGRRGIQWDSKSVFSRDSGDSKADRWSMLSDLTLGDLSISEISVLELPVDLSELYDPRPYHAVADLKQVRRRINLWSSRGRLHEAIRTENVFVLKTLLNLGVDIDEMDVLGRTPLSYAAAICFNDKTCELLVDKGADVNSADSSGRTPLSYAAALNYGDNKTCELLVDKGADVNSADSSGRTPLSYAAAISSNEKTCKILVDKGANVNSADSSGRTPLSYAAAMNQNYKTCKILGDKGADVNSADFSGNTPLDYAYLFSEHEDTINHQRRLTL